MAKVLLRLQPAVLKIVFKGILVAALLFEATRVECGVKMDVSTPESSRAALTQRLTVSLSALLCGFLKLIRNPVSFPRRRAGLFK